MITFGISTKDKKTMEDRSVGRVDSAVQVRKGAPKGRKIYSLLVIGLAK